VLRQHLFIETQEVVIRLRIEKKQIGQPLLGEKPLAGINTSPFSTLTSTLPASA